MTGVEVIKKVVTKLGSLWPFPVVVAEPKPEPEWVTRDNYESPTIIGAVDESAIARFFQLSHEWMEFTPCRCPVCERLDPRAYYRTHYHPYRTGCSSGGVYRFTESRLSNLAPPSPDQVSHYKEFAARIAAQYYDLMEDGDEKT